MKISPWNKVFAGGFASAMAANVTGQAITSLIQLLSIPIFLHYWNIEKYGYWIIISAVPAYFSLADVGFIAVAANRMTMLTARAEDALANVIFQSVLKLSVYLIAIFMVSFAVVVFLFDWGDIDTEVKRALVLLVAAALLSICTGLIDAVCRASGDYAFGVYSINFTRLLEWAGLIFGLAIGRTFFSAALGQFAARVLASLWLFRLCARRHPRFSWSFSQASKAELKNMLRPALAFMAFPIGNAISLQGMTLMAGHVLGPAFVAVFNTYRTLARMLVQIVTILSRSIWPTFSRLYGEKDLEKIRIYFFRIMGSSVLISVIAASMLYVFGPWILKEWTRDKISVLPNLWLLFLIATVLTSVWQGGMVLLSSANKHEKFATLYLLCACLSVATVPIFVKSAGYLAPTLGMIFFELAIISVTFFQVRRFFRDPIWHH